MQQPRTRPTSWLLHARTPPRTPLSSAADDDDEEGGDSNHHGFHRVLADRVRTTVVAVALGTLFGASTMFGGLGPAVAAAAQTAADQQVQVQSYDGFAEYAQENQMQQSDVGCFVTKCLDETKALFSNPRGIKGTTCLGRCKGEPTCAQRCFAEYGSDDLNNWLSCTIEENECVKVPRNVDNTAENTGYSNVVRAFDPKTLVGEWYKTYGLDPNNDLFDCQTNTFAASTPDGSEMDLGIFFRLRRPDEAGGGFWENHLTEHMVVDAVVAGDGGGSADPSGRTMHTQGKMFGLQFYENWYILGESDGKGAIPPFKLVAYKGHTLQGNYEGAFVYSKESRLPNEAIPAVREAAQKAGLDWNKFQPIDNTW
jgi:VDE lipocalin domain